MTIKIMDELRSLMQHTTLNKAQRNQLWSLAQLSHDTDTPRHLAEVVPYLQGFPQHFEEPFLPVQDIDCVDDFITLDMLARALPCACFDLTLNLVKVDEIKQISGAHLWSQCRTLKADYYNEDAFFRLLLQQDFSRLTSFICRTDSMSVEALNMLLAATFTPNLRSLSILGLYKMPSPGFWATLAHSNRLNNLTSFEIDRCDVSGFETLVNAHAFAQLNHLGLANSNLGHRGATLLATSKQLTQLTSLNLESCDIDAPALSVLGHAQNLKALESLSYYQPVMPLDESPEQRSLILERETINVLIHAPNFAHLTTLKLNCHSIADEDLTSFAQAPFMNTLQHLELSWSTLDADSLQALLQHKNLHALNTLVLDHNKLGDRGAYILAKNQELATLDTLDIRQNHITPEGICALVGSPSLYQLSRLKLYGNCLGVEGVRALIKQGWIAKILYASCELYLPYSDLTDDGVIELVNSPQLDGITALDLSSCNFGDRGVLAIANSPYLSKLTYLNLYDNPLISHDGIKALANSSNIKNLQRFQWDSSEARTDAVQALARSPYLPHSLRQLYEAWEQVSF